MTQLKHLFALFVCVMVAACFTACSDDEPENNEGQEQEQPQPIEKDPLIGTWIEDDSDVPYTLILNENGQGSISAAITENAPSRVVLTITQNFQWTKGVTADGITYVNILTISGDEILDDGRYSYTIMGNIMSFGGLRFTRL